MDICIYGNLDAAKEVVKIQYNERIRKIEVYSLTNNIRYYPSNNPNKTQGFSTAHTLINALLFAKHWYMADNDRAVIIDRNYLGGHPLPREDNII